MDAVGGDDGESVRLVEIGCDFGDELVRCHTDRSGQPSDLPDAGFDSPRDGYGVPEELLARRNVEEGLVEG